jgi:hypothetical protein
MRLQRREHVRVVDQIEDGWRRHHAGTSPLQNPKDDEVMRRVTHGGAAGAGTTAPLPLCRGPRGNRRGDPTVELAWKTSNGGCHAVLVRELDERKIL